MSIPKKSKDKFMRYTLENILPSSVEGFWFLIILLIIVGLVFGTIEQKWQVNNQFDSNQFFLQTKLSVC